LHIPEPKRWWQFIHKLTCIINIDPVQNRVHRILVILQVEYGPQIPKLLLCICINTPLTVIHRFSKTFQNYCNKQIHDHHTHDNYLNYEKIVCNWLSALFRYSIFIIQCQRQCSLGTEAYLRCLDKITL